MNRLAKWMMRLYPANWRARYGDELDALVSDAGADTRVVTDLLKGGIRMQFKAWSFPALALTLGILGAILGAGVGLLLPSQYTSRARLQVTSPVDESSLKSLIWQNQMQIFSRSGLSVIVQDPDVDLYADERKSTPLEWVLDEMKQNISFQFVPVPGDLGNRAVAFDIAFTYPDRLKAQEAVQQMVSMFRSDLESSTNQSSDGPDTGLLTVVDTASLPVEPIYPERPVTMLAGFLIGALIAWIWRMVQRTGFIARRFVPVALTFGLIGWVAIMVADYGWEIVPHRYRSNATVQLPQGTSPEQIAALEADALSSASLAAIIHDPRMDLYKDQWRTEPVQDVVQTMKQHLTVSPIAFQDRTFLTVSFVYYDRYKAQQTVWKILNMLMEADQRLYPSAGPPPESPKVQVSVLDEPSLPVSPVSPNRYRHAGLGCLGGVIAAAVIALLRRRWKPEAPASA